MIQLMRLAWFSPLPPVRSGIASVNARLLPMLDGSFKIDRFNETEAHDFVWKHRRDPYDLVVYQLGNAWCHDYIWAYVARFPGLIVLHDPRLHHARARQLLQAGRFDDYRREFRYDHPHAAADVAEYAIAGLGGPIYYQWPMIGVLMRTARIVAVHNAYVASDLRADYPESQVEVIRLGTPPSQAGGAARGDVRAALGISEPAIVFAVLGKITAEKRIGPIARAFAVLATERSDVHLVLAGDAVEYAELGAELESLPPSRVHVLGYVQDDAIDAYLAAADVCLCLRWPTALESSASWLQCLAAARPTVISDLAHLADVPTLEPHSGRPSRATVEPAAIAIDLLDEDAALVAAMRRLAADEMLRQTLGRAGHAYWSAHHTLDAMADDYRRVIALAAARPAPAVADLPAHFTDDYSGKARALAAQFGVTLDF